MSDTRSTIPPTPATEPIYTKGNCFWRGDERFLIKGISYVPCVPGGQPWGGGSLVDPLDDVRITELERDIEIFRELGLNTIQVSALDPSKEHDQAMNLLAKAGIYVLVTVCEKLEAPGPMPSNQTDLNPHFDTEPYYTTEILKPALKVVDELADHPNLLGFIVSGNAIKQPVVSKMAEVCRAAVRDVKAFLRMRGARCPPVGAKVKSLMMLRMPSLQYFTAGGSLDRVDFFAPDCYSWAYKSDFRVSGWKNMVEAFDKYPVPMLLGAYGAYVGRPRIWQEVGCLYSPDMTGVFSGGCLYTYFEHGNNFGIVKATEDGIVKKPEFARLKQNFQAVNGRKAEDLYSNKVKDYEHWVGEFPERSQNSWYATADVPNVSGGFDNLVQDLRDEQEWELVDNELRSDSNSSDAFIESTNDLAEGVARMTVDDKS